MQSTVLCQRPASYVKVGEQAAAVFTDSHIQPYSSESELVQLVVIATNKMMLHGSVAIRLMISCEFNVSFLHCSPARLAHLQEDELGKLNLLHVGDAAIRFTATSGGSSDDGVTAVPASSVPAAGGVELAFCVFHHLLEGKSHTKEVEIVRSARHSRCEINIGYYERLSKNDLSPKRILNSSRPP